MKKIYFVICCFLIVSCISKNEKESKLQYRYHSGPIQGTMFNIKYEWDKDLSVEIDSLLETFNTYLSNYDPNSIISGINNNTTDQMNGLVAEMVNTSIEVYYATDGAFDITIAPIVNLWGFGWEKDGKLPVPEKTKIDSALVYVGMDKIQTDGMRIIKSDPNVAIIGNAIAQGLSADYVSDYFLSLGLNNFLVEIGGEIYTYGLNAKKEPWKVGIDKPIEGSGYDNRENQLIVSLSGHGIATSGNYRKFIENDNKKFGHSMNPKTGYPAENSLLSVSVISGSAMLSDAYATAFMVLGVDESIVITEKTDGIESYFIYLDDNNTEKVKYSSGFEKFIFKQ